VRRAVHQALLALAPFAIEPMGTFADATHAGNIGGGLLQPFVPVLDHGGERLALRERAAR
jgi:hypothetical protein